MDNDDLQAFGEATLMGHYEANNDHSQPGHELDSILGVDDDPVIEIEGDTATVVMDERPF